MIKKAAATILASGLSIAAAMTPLSASAADERFVLISHAPDADSWWNTIKNAIKAASNDLDVTVEYRNPPTGDLADMARIVEQSIASNPDGIIVTIADYDVLKKPLQKAIKKNIPVVTINSGTHDQSEQLGALLHVGQPEYDAGYGAGKRAKAAGVNNFVCVNNYITNPASVERCKGFADAIGVGLDGNMIDVGVDPTNVEKKVTAHLRKNPDIGAVLTLGPASAHPTLRALKKMRKSSDIYFGTFDVSEDIVKAIKSGEINFAIDQQPYLQGYLPVVTLALYSRYGIVPGNNINSGPGFITKENVALVEKLAGEIR